MAQRYQGKRRLAPPIQAEKFAHPRIDEAKHDLCRNLAGSRCSRQVCENGAVIPVAVAIRARLVLPGIAPKRRRARDHARRVHDCRLFACRTGEGGTVISRAQSP